MVVLYWAGVSMVNTVEWVDDALFLCIWQSGYFSQYACFEERTVAAWNVHVLYSGGKYEWIDIKKSVSCKHETPNKPFWFNFITFNICFPCKCYYIILYYVGQENMFHRINLSLTEEQRQTWCSWENWQGRASSSSSFFLLVLQTSCTHNSFVFIRGRNISESIWLCLPPMPRAV